MKLTQELKDRIDKMTYIELLTKWRFAPIDDPFFQGAVGEYFANRMNEMRRDTPIDEQVAASKSIGWDR